MTKDEEIEALKRTVRTLAPSDRAKALTGKRALKKLLDVDKPEEDWSKVWRKCSNCKKVKVVIQTVVPDGEKKDDWGLRTVRGVQRPQGYCRRCRNTLNYHGRPRVNRSKNWPGES